jgi:2-hydroxychromene-2-carboxylate isomerase
MGQLIDIAERLADRSRPGVTSARFFFALDDPISYLAAERVERALGAIEWVPVLGPLSQSGSEERQRLAGERLRLAEQEAERLGLPIVEPHRYPMDSRRAARAGCFAAESGAGGAFAIALLRLGFCGGFDISSAPVIEEAAAVSGIAGADAVAAAGDQRYDARIDATSRGLVLRGISSPPAIAIGSSFFEGSSAVFAAVSFSAAQGVRDEPWVS